MREARIKCPHCGKPITVRERNEEEVWKIWHEVDELFREIDKKFERLGNRFERFFRRKR